MKKVYLLGALTGLMMASCANDDLVVKQDPVGETTTPLSFNLKIANQSRANLQDAGFNDFGVWAIKVNGDDDAATDAALKDLTLNLNDQNSMSPNVVINHYKVEYDANTERYGSHWTYETVTGQYLKYWDGSYKNTFFFAYAPYANSVAFTNKDDKASNNPSLTFSDLQLSSSSAYNFVYADVTKAVNSEYIGNSNKVPLQFKRLMSQIRIVVYEAIEGYEVTMQPLTFSGSTDTHGVVAIPANYNGTPATWSRGEYLESGKAKVVYSGVNLANSDLSYTDGAMGDENLEFAIPSTTLKTSYTTAVAAPFETVYNVLPNGTTTQPTNLTMASGKTWAANSGLQFVMNFQLKAEDTQEVINVKGARVYVAPDYTAWAPNTIYTYVFRITKGTSGTTTTTDPNPDPENPQDALYPIIFDSITVTDLTEGVTQEWDVNPEGSTTNPHNPNGTHPVTP